MDKSTFRIFPVGSPLRRKSIGRKPLPGSSGRRWIKIRIPCHVLTFIGNKNLVDLKPFWNPGAEDAVAKWLPLGLQQNPATENCSAFVFSSPGNWKLRAARISWQKFESLGQKVNSVSDMNGHRFLASFCASLFLRSRQSSQWPFLRSAIGIFSQRGNVQIHCTAVFTYHSYRKRQDAQ